MNKTKGLVITIIVVLAICLVIALTINFINNFNEKNNTIIEENLTPEEQEKRNNQILQNLSMYAQ